MEKRHFVIRGSRRVTCGLFALVERQRQIRQNGQVMKEERWHEMNGPRVVLQANSTAHLAYADTSLSSPQLRKQIKTTRV